MIHRRAFVSVVAGGLAAPSFTANAQRAPRVVRIGVLGNTNGPTYPALVEGLRELGYVEGGNVAFLWRWAEGNAELYPELAADLVRSNADIIVTTSTQSTRAAKQATSSIPIVMAISAHPDRVGLVNSLARPGGNITGLTNMAPELAGKRLELLREIAPRVSRVAVLWNPSGPVEPMGLHEETAAGQRMGLHIEAIEVRTQEDYPAAFSAVISSGANALHPFGNPVNFKNRQLLTAFASSNRLPAIYEERVFVEAGGLLSYAPSFIDHFKRAATFVDKILKGARPGDLPIQQPTKFELVINARAAKALGVTVSRSLLQRADEVIQ